MSNNWDYNAQTSLYDNVVIDQGGFNALFERTAANIYEPLAGITSIYLKSGTYLFASLLSGGDTWGNIRTRNCTLFEVQPGAEINFGTTNGGMIANTAGGVLKNVKVTGGVTTGAVVSFLLGAERVTFENCSVYGRTSSGASNVGFQGSGVVLSDLSSSFVNCKAYNLDGTGACVVRGFNLCYNLTNPTAYDLDGAASVFGYTDCEMGSNCVAADLESTGGVVHGFSTCDALTAAYALQLDSAGGECYGFWAGNRLASCKAHFIASSTHEAYGFSGCEQVLGSHGEDIESAAAAAYGFRDCYIVSGCFAEDVESLALGAHGFYDCDQISACYALDISHTGAVALQPASGFDGCSGIVACEANTISTNGAGGVEEGFRACTYGAALFTNKPVNTLNDYIDSGDADIVNQYSTPDLWTV